MRRFEFSTGGSDKFWEVELSGSDVTVKFGRIGTNGQTQTKSLPSDGAAQKEYDKLIAEKLKKGYVEITSFAPGGEQPKAAGRNVESLKAVLEKAGADLSMFQRVEVGDEEDGDEDEGRGRRSDDSFYMAIVPKEIAVDVWRAVRNSVDTTGYWPIFTEDHYDLFEFMEFNEDEAPNILKHAGAIDPTAWLKERVEKEKDLFAELDDTNGDDGWNPNSQEANDAAADDYYVVQNIGVGTSTMIFCPTKTPWHVAAVLRWGGANDGIEPWEHTAMHKYWHTEFGAEPVSATNGILEFRVSKPPKTREAAMALAREQFIYCPDIVHQGCATVAGLASELIYSPRWYFWWD